MAVINGVPKRQHKTTSIRDSYGQKNQWNKLFIDMFLQFQNFLMIFFICLVFAEEDAEMELQERERGQKNRSREVSITVGTRFWPPP